MKKSLIILFACIAIASCAVAKDRQPFKVQQWMKMRSDGYWVVTTIFSNRTRSDVAYECKPDSITLANIKP